MNSVNPEIRKILAEKNMITTTEVMSMGYSKQLLSKYVQEGLLERVRQGVYILPDAIHDDMYTLMMRSEYIVFSHESALFLDGLAERTPFMHSITLPSNKSIPGSIKHECICFYITPELHGLGMIERRTGFGNVVRCYNAERTICDFLRTRDRCDEETVISAIKNYASYGKKNLNRLAFYAQTLKVASELKKYMEVLL